MSDDRTGVLAEALARWRDAVASEDNSGRAATALLTAAEESLAAGGTEDVDRSAWTAYLEHTRRPAFLCALTGADSRNRWAESTFAICEGISFGLGDLLEQRATAHPRRVLFRELTEAGGGRWDYGRIHRRVRQIAALFWRSGPSPVLAPGGDRTSDGPRVALLTANSIASACCDLACLTHDLLDTPLNIHFSVDDLSWIFARLRITVAVCDNPDRLETLLSVRRELEHKFDIYTLHMCDRVGQDGIFHLDEQLAKLDPETVDTILGDRPRRTMREPATIMFTSGSTGRPKGVSFSQFNLVSKRFARAAALPAVGNDEVMLCYLPLFHTFGRYLEMLGSIFWGGTYVFAGNPSVETLLSQFQEVRPTALISVPVRWAQIHERAIAHAREAGGKARLEDSLSASLRELVGDRLYWGLSAAGYLDPRVFRFFHRCGVALCSGFGMTEGTGGLTMTPPGDYVEGSVGIPLPGVKVRFGEQDELQIAGPYIARYLPADAPGGSLRVEQSDSDDLWLATGDLFRKTRGEHLEIVDRIKDIYKNNKGQTIAPRQVESLFDQVPGIKRTFLAGDGRSYNTLLIVPDEDDPLLSSLADDEARREYFEQIVTLANPGLAAFERVVNFTVLARDFSGEAGELTAKGSFRRKKIEENFATEITALYRRDRTTLAVDGYEVRIPRWFFRDLGVLDDSVRADDSGLRNKETGSSLRLHRTRNGRVRIGDLEYELEDKVIDLGLLARQPRLWVANSGLVGFAPCRLGWDTDLGPFSEQVFLPHRARSEYSGPPAPGRVDRQLVALDELCRQALFGDAVVAQEAVRALNDELERVSPQQGIVIRRRLEALANHPIKAVRCRAYQVLVLDQPVADYNRYLPAFIESGKSFLDKESFEAIGRAAIEPRRLEALRQRMHAYRTQLDWPTTPKRRRVFEDLFHLLADFGRFHPEFYGPIREELISWALHDVDPLLATAAEQEMTQLGAWLENQLHTDGEDLSPAAWRGKLVFQEGLSQDEIKRLNEVLVGTTFLKQSVMLAFEGEHLALRDIKPSGVFISRIISRYEDSRYRASINTVEGKHFDLQIIIRQDADESLVNRTIYWYIALRGYPFGTPMLPTFGCSRPELGALSMAYVSDLTVWEKIREFSSVRGPGTKPPSRMRWHQLMVRAMTVVVRGWRNSGRRIIPGLITPNNIVVPEPDFRRGAVQNNLTGWKPYTGPLSLIRPLWRNIYQHTVSHYPWVKEYLEREWILEAFVEALGVPDALDWFAELRAEMAASDEHELDPGFDETLAGFVARLESSYFQPLSLQGAISRYRVWLAANPDASPRARLEIIDELSRLYRLDRLPEITRFTLFRHTYFLTAAERLTVVFDQLLDRMFRHPRRWSTKMVELSDLQDLLVDQEDRVAFNRLVFPHRMRHERMEVETVGNPERGYVIVRSTITDKHGQAYSVGEPRGPAEVGLLYRLFLQAGFPKALSRADRYFVAIDETEQLIGGLVYRVQGEDEVLLDGIVVRQTVGERGIAAAILADFCTRMASRGYKTIKTHYFLRRFYEKHGFRHDQRLGGLVRFL